MGSQPRAEAGSRTASEAWAAMQEFMFSRQRPRWMAIGAEFDLTPPQVMTINRIEPDRPAPMSDIARWLACDASNVTGITDRLEKRGLLERQNDPGDRRVRMLALTPEGLELRAELQERSRIPPPEIIALSAEDQASLRDILLRVMENRGP